MRVDMYVFNAFNPISLAVDVLAPPPVNYYASVQEKELG